MWRQHHICGVALLTLGIGIFIGCACGATLISILLALGFLCCGCFLLRKNESYPCPRLRIYHQNV